ncbi:DUF6855 family protein [Leifsonia sp. AG29]|uniref:DUF6855 family protein n=1 Tax=Leifsonia sp. AG29 TaxID=2598860 RepID=UPI002D80CCE6|nr:hypothetical protein [Leifsonia sp. AG29]
MGASDAVEVTMPEGTADDPWRLKTAPGTSEYTMWRDDSADPPALVLPGRRHPPELPRERGRRPRRLAARAG